jgi:hypothetical protein
MSGKRDDLRMMRNGRIWTKCGLGILPLLAWPAIASTPAAWAKGERAARTVCASTSGLNGAGASPAVHFDDRSARDVLLVEGWARGRWIAKRRRATMLCLYDRRTGKAEVSEAPGWKRTTTPG